MEYPISNKEWRMSKCKFVPPSTTAQGMLGAFVALSQLCKTNPIWKRLK